jgi:DnaJ-class molecular chaperone
MPRLRGEGRGDLLVRLRAKLPERLAEHERKLFEELRSAGV